MASMQFGVLQDPLTMNLQKQWVSIAAHVQDFLLEELESQEEILRALARLLYDPRYTLLIAQKFRPILIVLCAQWLDYDGEEDAKIAALALLVNPHEELFPILSAFLRNSSLSKGLMSDTSTSTPTTQLHLRLLAYYRILAACPHIPASFGWSTEPLLKLISFPHPDRGVCWLAVRCYALHTLMTEVQRDELQFRLLGLAGEIDVPIQAGASLEGQPQYLDGWILPALEEIHIQDSREAMLEQNDFYDHEKLSTRIEIDRITRRLVDVHGILFLKDASPVLVPSRLIPTTSTDGALRELAVRTSLRLPTLLSSPPSSGKTLLINHLASLLHPSTPNQVITLHLSDTSLDARSLLGSYVTSTLRPGSFEWQEGIVPHAMRHGLWLVLEEIDRASSDVLGTLIPLLESLGVHKHIGAPASLEVPGHGKVIAAEGFMIFATRSIIPVDVGKLPSPTFLGANKFSCVDVPAPTDQDLAMIINSQCPRLGRRGSGALIRAWKSAKALGPAPGARNLGIHELETWCKRVESLLRHIADMDMDMDAEDEIPLERIYPHVALREDMFLEARDVFFGAGAFSETARTHIAKVRLTFAEHLGLSFERAEWVLEGRVPDLQLVKDGNGRTSTLEIGKTRLSALRTNFELLAAPQRPFAMHRPALLLTERIAASVSFSEPVLLVGETGTGKTTLVSHIASLLNRKLVSLNLSHQTESSDLVGGFKPVDTRVPGSDLQRRFTDLFSRTFSRRKNSKFEDAVRKGVNEGKWKRVVGLWKESMRLALDKIRERSEDGVLTEERKGVVVEAPAYNGDAPRKRRRLAGDAGHVQESEWLEFDRDVQTFDVQHIQGKGKFAFGFVEGPLVEALRNGHWVLLDEINLASPETLECISSILQGPTASVVLTEQGSFAPVSRHPDFRLFACMNPATDVGKKDLSPSIRSRFTEIHVPAPDADRETLLAIIQQYIGHCALADKRAMLDVSEFYMEVKKLAEGRELADGSNHRPHFSMRTLTRALTFTSDAVATFGLRRALWEGCLMAFSMALDEKSAILVKNLAEKHLLTGVKNVRAMMAQTPAIPGGGQAENFERIGSFWLELGNLKPDPASEYILTPSVQSKLIDLARVVLTRRFPVLIEGPTSSGKTSAIEYLARRTGHRFVRVNNHEHTDIQEYLGTYVSDPETGKLVFHDGILVRALRNGDWIVLDELNLAPTDVLEALNRLLDDNRELVIPETQEVVRPHPHFMLFATQNPPGLYAGRKILSRAFRNRFLEVHFDDVPQSELQTILAERCRIPDSYAKRIVSVFQELSKRRQAGRVFETKHGFATLRDLFRWAGREAFSTQQLAQNGYMLLAERARRADDKVIVKEVIETVMKETIDIDALYDIQGPDSDVVARLGVPVPMSSDVIWTSAMKRLFALVANALRFNEPVLLVGQTGSGKTSVCQLFAKAALKQLISLNCHQSTETADLIGGQRPLRNRQSSQLQLIEKAREVLRMCNVDSEQEQDVEGMLSLVKKALKIPTLLPMLETSLQTIKQSLQRSTALFEWHDGPLIRAMRSGDVFLLDEISLADDSVLERLNSVLEPARNIVLAERGGLDVEHAQVTAEPDFKLVATMNPGGDYGKKELSPALRNRFTEIWVPQVETRSDRRMIIDHSWRHDHLRRYTDSVLSFTEWLTTAVGELSVASLRDLLTWVEFSNAVCDSNTLISLDVLFHHAAHLVFLDGLESSPHTSSWTFESLHDLRARGRAYLEEIVPLGDILDQVFDGALQRTSDTIRFGAFGVSQGPYESISGSFSLLAPTTLDNIRQLVRACQVFKPILLEGSPGVGKTSLVSALGDVSGNRLCRINLSDQTDLMDLFGSDLPVEGGKAGEFAWKDATFLRAMQDGDWVLLDEMNLAPQAVLEGLNAVLDHRGTVYIPELGRSFTKHPGFRIFAAQNPLHQGGGRKGLPRSFLDRFTRVHVKALSSEDLLLICQSLFPDLPIDHLKSMILFNSRLHEETMVKHSFGRDGSPWEFNLRDVIRWATLLASPSSLSVSSHPSNHLDTVYLQRFRTETDRLRAIQLFQDTFSLTQVAVPSPWVSTTPEYVQFGSTLLERGDHVSSFDSVELQHHLRPLASISECMHRGWLSIISGAAGAGKTHLVRYLATAAGRCLREFSMSSGVDTSDLLGSFEQVPGNDANAARFEWMDGPLVKAVKEGHWLVLDNANLCSPSVLDRLNSLCETNGLLVLTERGHVQGEVVILRPHPQFRLILTLDPRNGELSRAMRNRGIEVHLPINTPSLQDHLRIRNAIRTPLLSESTATIPVDDLVIQFELLRRGHVPLLRLKSSSAPGTAHGRLSGRDSVSSTALDQAALDRLGLSQDHRINAYARSLFWVFSTPPSQNRILRRMLPGTDRASEERRFLCVAVLEALQHQTCIWSLRRGIEKSVTETRRVPVNFLLNQPLDISMNPNLLVNDRAEGDNVAKQQHALSRAIELAVHVHFSDNREPDPPEKHTIFHQSRLFKVGQGGDVDSAPGVASIFPLYSSIMELANNVLKTSNPHDCGDLLSLIGDTKRLVDIVEHLRHCCSGARFDFTSARVISTWLQDVLANNSTLRQSFILPHVETLMNDVSLTSGHGMQEIWCNFTAPKLQQNVISKAARLDHLGVCLDSRHNSFHRLRTDVFNAMSLLTLKMTPSMEDQESVLGLCNDVEQRLINKGVADSEVVYTHQMAIAELDFLSTALASSDYRTGLRRAKFFIELTTQTAHASFDRVTKVQHYLWRSETIGARPNDLSFRATLLQQWMSALNGLSVGDHSHGPDVGPGTLLKPILLQTIIGACRHDRALDNLESHESALCLEGQLTVNHCQDGMGDRMCQIMQVWKGALLIIARCFEETYSSETMQAIVQAASAYEDTSTCSHFIGLLSRTTHPQLSGVVRDRLLPVSRRLDECSTEFHKIGYSGKMWVATGMALLDIYVPNVPLDPLAAQRCILEFWSHREVEIQAQIRIHATAETITTGNVNNPVLSTLRSRLDAVRANLQSPINLSISRDLDIDNLHALHGELTQFLNHIGSPKFEATLHDLEVGHEDANARALMVQNTITGFILRMELAYPHFADIIQPISMALSQVIFGLHLLLHASRRRAANPQVVDHLCTLVAFPTVTVMDTIWARGSQNAASSAHLLLSLIATGYTMHHQGTSAVCFARLDEHADQLTKLWLEDREQEERDLQESQSLYRHTNVEHHLQEAEIEEQEFHEMFPNFEPQGVDDLEEARPVAPSPVTLSKGRRITDKDLERVYRISMCIAELPHSGRRNELYEEFHELRNTWVHDALDSHSSWFPQTIDTGSLPYQVLLLSNATKELKGHRPMKRGTYSFYHDSNIPEARKAMLVIRSITGRLHQLLDEWPDQMVLHHIMGRCEAVLKLDLHSPVAKILTALEQLLLQTEDWEIYSNRENTLKPQQAMLSSLIVDWRRFELSCWSQLLETQSLTFSAGTAEWWFRLYELTIRGTLAAVAEGTATLDAYFTTMIPLVEQFVSAGPLGQYTARMRLLKSFSEYATNLSAVKMGSESAALTRASRILHSLHSFYDQFSVAVSQSLAEKRTTLEKELADFIKLASWKDVNVHALRQSAQRTHRQLYKCIRKFRELLREPVTPFLSYRSTDEKLGNFDPSKLQCDVLDTSPIYTFPKILRSDGLPSYLLDLPRTFSKFKDLLESHGKPMISAVSFNLVDDLAGEIADTAATLSTETSAAGNDKRVHKTLIMRKRKAWVDLLKELKRAGFSSRLRPEILEQQQNKVWLMDRAKLDPSRGPSFSTIMSKGEEYFNRMLVSMPDLRRSLASHNGDLPTRELERGIMFVESSFSFACSSRSRLAADYELYESAHRVAQRLRHLSETKGSIRVACDIAPWLELCYKLEDALREVSSRCADFCALGDTTSLSSSVVEAVSAHIHVISNACNLLTKVSDNVHLANKILMVSEEYLVLDEVRANILSTQTALRNWMCEEPRIRHLCHPVLVWLESSISGIAVEPANEPSGESPAHGNLIDRLLVIVQGILTSNISSEPSSDSESPDNYASESEKASSTASRLFSLNSVSQALSSFMEELIDSSPAKRLEKIQIVLPFVESYLVSVYNHLLVEAQLTKAFLKLSYILCTVVSSLSTQGFCKPSDMEEESGKQGDGTELQDGTGMGQGTGSENVSNQIEDESQVEGLRGEDSSQEQTGNEDAKEDGIEMGDDFEGEMGDVENDDAEQGSDSGSEPEAEEQVGDVDPSDSDAVDEKLWGDEKVAGEAAEGKTSKEGMNNPEEDSEVAAKESDGKGKKDRQDEETGEMMEQEDAVDEQGDSDMPEDHPIDAGKQMDDFVPEANTLDLPDDLNLADEEDGAEEENVNAEDDLMDEDGLDEGNLDAMDGELAREESPPPSGHEEGLEEASFQSPQLDEKSEDNHMDPAASRPDVSAGNNEMGDSNAQSIPPHLADPSTEPKEDSQGGADGPKKEAREATQNDDPSAGSATPNPPKDDIAEHDPTSIDVVGPSNEPSSSLPNPLRSLGDTLKELKRRFDQIGDAVKPEASPLPKGDDGTPRVEYLQEGMVEEHDLQALGPAKEDQVVKLSELKISDNQSASNLPEDMNIQESEADLQEEVAPADAVHMDIEPSAISKTAELEDAITEREFRSQRPERFTPNTAHNETPVLNDIEMDNPEEYSSVEKSVELAVKEWQDTGHSDSRAAGMWRLYDSLTQELSFSLCEQLRLILEPTLATRLRGDYRTGKRLNMKKIIPYIASEYTKDKIWLRRTRPSQREYQVLIALDDSRSMAESRSVHLAYETLALVSKALNRLESGEVAIARFGESVEMVHGFEEGMVGDREGEKLMRRFKFEQRKTDVLGLVETSLKVLTQARERRSMGRSSNEAADLWQLEIIISDGICQDHEKLRTVLRKAEEQRVMIVFIVVDSLHTHHASSSTDAQAKATQNTILSMNQVSYKDVGGGRMELQMERYLDSFPFQYYVVLRSVEALPDVLSGTLKQFFERISEE